MQLRTVAAEIAGVVTHLLRYPSRPRRHVAAMPNHQQPPMNEPIILIPGLAVDASVFTVLQGALADRGAGPLIPFGYSPLIDDVRAAAAQLAAQVDQLCGDTGAERVHLVGHSLGGLIARYYVQRLDGHTRVDHVVTVATPHHGTHAAWLLSPLPLVRQLRPGSQLLTELAQPAPNCATHFVAFHSDADAVILPRRNARIDHPDLSARNELVPGAGHVTLPGHRQVVAGTCALLDPGNRRKA